MKSLFFISLLFWLNIVSAQKNDSLSGPLLMISQRLENLTESNGDVEPEDDYYLQQMERFIHHPINLNSASEIDLAQLQLLSPLHIQSFLSYRALLGHLVDIYELQAIPGWSIRLIERIRPYVSVTSTEDSFASLGDRFKNGHQSMLMRITRVLEKSNGYITDTSKTNFYMGSPLKLFVRYKNEFKSGIQYGVTGEKDAGEQFLKGHQKQGFDFYSAHFFARNIGFIKALALGDFAVNIGQGLIQWQSGLAARKGSDVLNIKRQEEVLRPYNSSGEINFHRGIGITIQKKIIQGTAFLSFRKLDANLRFDSIQHRDYISSYQYSGYHRTQNEIKDKGIQNQTTIGGNLSLTNARFHIGATFIHYSFKLPLEKRPELYNRFAFSGNSLTNYSTDFSYHYQNMLLFSEAAIDQKYNKAIICGLILSAGSHADLSFVYRSISRAFQSLYSNSFTEGSAVNNEKGLYAGISLTPSDALKITAYLDVYSFPWLKYRVDAPSRGNDFLIQVIYTPNKQVGIYSRYHVEKKALNDNPGSETLNPVVIHPRQAWRNEFNCTLSREVSIRTRVELNWYNRGKSNEENGFILYADVTYKPKFVRISTNTGFEYFETDGYNSRFYTFQHDVSYSVSAPLAYGKGYQYYMNIKIEPSRSLSLGMRIGQSLYPGSLTVGTGLDEIPGNKKTEVKLQAIFNL